LRRMALPPDLLQRQAQGVEQFAIRGTTALGERIGGEERDGQARAAFQNVIEQHLFEIFEGRGRTQIDAANADRAATVQTV